MWREMSVALALVSGLTLRVVAQGAPLQAEDASASLAVIEWYASELDRSPMPTLVLARQTNGAAVDAGGHGLNWGAQRTIPFAPTALGRLREHLGTDIILCDEYVDGSLCGAEQPWVWLLVSEPTRVGERLLIELEVRSIDLPPPGHTKDGGWLSESYILEVRRQGGEWRVSMAHP